MSGSREAREFFHVVLSDVPIASLVDADHAARWVQCAELMQ